MLPTSLDNVAFQGLFAVSYVDLRLTLPPEDYSKIRRVGKFYEEDFILILDKLYNVLYNVLRMLQIINITDARNNLAKLIEKIKATKEPVVIVQDSNPSVVLYPYDEILKREEEKNQLFRLKFQKIFREGELKFKQYLKKKSIRAPRSEKNAYSIIKNA